MLLPQEIIRKKRDGGTLTREEIAAFVGWATDDIVSEGQIGAFTMAVFLRGMTVPEVTALTLAMRDSGRVIDWSGQGLDTSRIIEKHSSAGVGDEKVTLLVVPLAAACGVIAPNVTGRGIDYCGGEVDMLDSIPGYAIEPSPELFMRVVKDVGCAIVGPTLDLAPADRKIFYVRDVSGTVESVPLITGSILSKKLAAGPRGLVTSVGCGSGAFMKTIEEARALANSMGEVAADAGLPNVMLITDLNSVLGTTVGNALEVIEVVDFLTGKYRDPRTEELTLIIAAEMIVLAGIVPDLVAARALAKAKLDDGSAAERFGRMVEALGGPRGFVAAPERHLPATPIIRPVHAAQPGYVASMDTKAIGLTLVGLGGGRKRPSEPIDFSVGMTAFVQLGERADAERPVCVVHALSEKSYDAAAESIRAAIHTSPTPQPAAGPIVRERIARGT
ncbi:MAG: thymidine phosphorylase [Bauldia sp.]